MDARQLDAIVRVVGVTLLLLLAMMLMRDRKERRLALSFAPLAICLSGFLIGNTADPSLRLHGLIAAAAHLSSGYAVAFLWWFCLTVFDRSFTPRGPALAVGLAWVIIASVDRGLLGAQFADKGLSWVLVVIGFGIVAQLAWRLIRDRESDLLERRRDARIAVVVLLAGLLFVELSKEVIFGLDARPRVYTVVENAAFATFTLWLLMLRAGAEPLLAKAVIAPSAIKPVNPSREAEGEAKLVARIAHLIEVERVHLDPGLTFDAFVRKSGASERSVRRLINHRLGHDHFRSFLNVHRTAEARRLLAEPSRAGDKLVSIAQDSGFSSLASFNRVFRAIEGCAPSAYRTAHRGGAVAAGLAIPARNGF